MFSKRNIKSTVFYIHAFRKKFFFHRLHFALSSDIFIPNSLGSWVPWGNGEKEKGQAGQL